ncbi:hypothetical protein GUI12_01935 [Anaplasmataceae bacterium AB001_6]|nr:hypothetical protein GUI12_01935 [Anaplasmataceae bacterium AB001_6]
MLNIFCLIGINEIHIQEIFNRLDKKSSQENYSKNIEILHKLLEFKIQNKNQIFKKDEKIQKIIKTLSQSLNKKRILLTKYQRLNYKLLEKISNSKYKKVKRYNVDKNIETFFINTKK